jgi:hypothetical protein
MRRQEPLDFAEHRRLRGRPPRHARRDRSGAAPSCSTRLELTDFLRAEHIGALWASPHTRSLADLAIDAEEDRMVRPLLITMLRERQRR